MSRHETNLQPAPVIKESAGMTDDPRQSYKIAGGGIDHFGPCP